MTTDEKGNPYIVTYWRESDSAIPQYHIIYHADGIWKTLDLGFRKTAFSLSGHGTKRIPIARPQIVASHKGGKHLLMVLFRDEERGSKASMAVCSDLGANRWEITDLTDFSVGSWEPSYDTELWRGKRKLHVFVQETEQADAEGISGLGPQPVQVVEAW